MPGSSLPREEDDRQNLLPPSEGRGGEARRRRLLARSRPEVDSAWSEEEPVIESFADSKSHVSGEDDPDAVPDAAVNLLEEYLLSGLQFAAFIEKC